MFRLHILLIIEYCQIPGYLLMYVLLLQLVFLLTYKFRCCFCYILPGSDTHNFVCFEPFNPSAATRGHSDR